MPRRTSIGVLIGVAFATTALVSGQSAKSSWSVPRNAFTSFWSSCTFLHA